MRRKLGWISLYLVIIFFAISSKGWGFLIPPSRLDIEVSAGEEREFSLYLANPQERDNIRVKVYTEDFFLRRDSSLEFLRPGSLKCSCAQLLLLLKGLGMKVATNIVGKSQKMQESFRLIKKLPGSPAGRKWNRQGAGGSSYSLQ